MADQDRIADLVFAVEQLTARVGKLVDRLERDSKAKDPTTAPAPRPKTKGKGVTAKPRKVEREPERQYSLAEAGAIIQQAVRQQRGGGS